MDFDLSLLHGKRTVKLNGKEIEFKKLKLEEHLELEFDAQTLDKMEVRTRKDIKKLVNKLHAYVSKVLIIEPEDLEYFGLTEYKNLRKYMSRLDMYDQGFTDSEIDELEKKAAFRVINESTTV